MTRKAGKPSSAVVSVLQCDRASGPEAGRAGRDGGKMSLLQPEKQKIFGSKGCAAREEPHSSRPATPAQFSLSVPLRLDFILFRCQRLKTKGMVEMPKIETILGKC